MTSWQIPDNLPDETPEPTHPPSAGPAAPAGSGEPAASNSTPTPAEAGPVAGLPPMKRSDLVAVAESLGVEVPHRVTDADLSELVNRRFKLIGSLPRKPLDEIATWASLDLTPNADRIALVKRISQLPHTRFPGLSTDGLRIIAMLRDCPLEPDDSREAINRKLKAKEGFWAKFRRKRRAVFGKWIAGMIGDEPDHSLPEELRPISLKERIEQEGIVSGLSGKIRGVADDYVRTKLDEIEARIDRKLDEIDNRLAEWRDREIAHRLNIIRITLIASVLVALLSLGYTYVKHQFPGWLP